MRNLKKLLALVLVFAMTLALVPMAAAADFSDADKIENKEAVELLVTLGILKGHSDGSFDPEGHLTRSEAAKILYAATRGIDDGAGIFKGPQLFKDVYRGHWAEGYINYAAAMDYVAGHSNPTGNVFDPDGKVTGYQFLKMLLCALGYDATIERFVNDAVWEYNVLAIAIRTGLTEGFVGSLSEPLTRDNMALITAGFISASTIRYDNGRSLETGVSFGEEKLGLISVTGIAVANELASIGAVEPTRGGTTVKVGDKYVLLPASVSLDMLGMEISALVSIKSGKTLVDAQGNYNSASIDKVFGEIESTDNNTIIELNGKEKYNENATFLINFASADKADLLELAASAGHTVRAISNDGDTNIDIVIGIEYSFDKVSGVTSKGVVTLAGNKLDSENAIGIESLKAGDMAIWFRIDGGKYVVEMPDTMSGKATGYTATYVLIDGKRYAPATGISGFVSSDAPLSTEATWFMFNGMILGCTETGEVLVPSYALVTRSTSIGWEYRVELITDGGEMAIYTLANPNDVVVSNAVPNGLYTYSMTEDGKVELKVADITGTSETDTFSYTREFNRILGKLINSKTIVFAEVEGKWVVYTGINNIPSLAGDEAARKILSVTTTMFEDDDAYAVVVLPNLTVADDMSAEQHYIVLSDVVYVGDSKYTFKAWNGTEVEEFTSTKNVETGAIYTFAFGQSGNVTAVTKVSGQQGYLTHAADYTLRLGEAGSANGDLYTYNDKTAVYEIDLEGGTVEKSRFADLTLIPDDQVADQEADSFDTIVVVANGLATVVYKFVG